MAPQSTAGHVAEQEEENQDRAGDAGDEVDERFEKEIGMPRDGLVGPDVRHAPEQGAEHQQRAGYREQHEAGEKKQVDHHQRETEEKEQGGLVSREARRVVAEEDDGEQHAAANPEHAEAGRLELDEKQHQPGGEEQRRDSGDELRDLFRPRHLKPGGGVVTFPQQGVHQAIDIRGNARAEQGQGGIAVSFHRLGGGEGEEFVFGFENFLPDLEHEVLVDHRGKDFAAVALAVGNGADAGFQIGDDLRFHRLIDVLAAARNGSRRADDSGRREMNLIRPGGNERARRDRLTVHVGDDFSGKFLDGLEHVEGHVEAAAGRFHVEDDRVRALLDGHFKPAAEDMEFRRRDLLADGDDDDLVLLRRRGFFLRREGGGKHGKQGEQ